MPRPTTISDPFHAVAAHRRREILDVLAGGERPVNEVVDLLGLAQPQVSKHLRVLREVGLVSVRGSGQRRLYRLNADRLKPIHDWVATFERFWDDQLDRIKRRAEAKAKERRTDRNDSEQEKLSWQRLLQITRFGLSTSSRRLELLRRSNSRSRRYSKNSARPASCTMGPRCRW
jgi:DNA-binding transcriptional ArsR family regulator